MSKNPEYPTTSEVNNKFGPDFFGFYTSEVGGLLSKDDGLLPFSHSSTRTNGDLQNELGRENGSTKNNTNDSPSLFSDGMGALLSEFKKETLRSLIRQSVFTLTKEVDEIVDPVLSICRIQSCLKCKEHLSSLDASTSNVDEPLQPKKKLKRACSNGPIMNSDSEDGIEGAEIDEDLRFLLKHDTTKVEEILKNHSDELLSTLNHMELKLEELLNTVMTSCRPMTPAEKQRLRKYIQNLPPKNFERIVEIIRLNKAASEKDSCDELHVDLDGMDNVTLWRLYFYVATIQTRKST